MLKLLRRSVKLGKLSRWSFVKIQRYISCLAFVPESHQKLYKTCKEFAEAELVCNAVVCDREQLFPKEQVKKMGELGLMGVAVSEELHGAGLDYLALAIAVEQVSRACATSGVTVAIHNALYLEPIRLHGDERQKKEYIAPYVTGDTVGCFGYNEPIKNSTAGVACTTAVEDGDKYVLNGIKSWITNGKEATAALVFATTDPSQTTTSMSTFIVPIDTKGLTLGERDDKLGIRGSSTCELVFEDCAVPKENMIGKPGDGFQIANTCFNAGRIGIASQAVGIAQASLELATRYAGKRVVLGTRISKLQAIQFKLADMALRVETARTLTWRAARLKDNGMPFGKEAAMAKVAASEAATWCSHQCIQILGAVGFGTELPAERYYRDARITELYVGTSEIHRVAIANATIREYGEEQTQD